MEPVCCAIEFNHQEADAASMMTEPLIKNEVAMGDDDEDEYASSPQKLDQEPVGSNPRFVFLGILTGFLIQVVSLGAYAFMLTQFGEDPVPSVNASEGTWFIYGILSILTQVDLVIYVLIWVAFTCTMTRNGMAFIRFQYQAPVARRSIFVLGVYFLVGIVLGAFVAWTLIDVYLGFPIPFAPIAATVVVDLALCYMMVWCYDLGREETIEDEESTACC